MSLGHRYLDDLAAQDPDCLVITTVNALKADPHLSDDKLQIVVTMVEATDDSFLFAKSLRAAQRFCLEMERFQFAYGWLTQWSKTFAYILNDKNPLGQERLSFPSVTVEPGVDPWTVKYYDVPVIRSGLDFLNAKVDDPGVRFNEMRDIIDAFSFPRLTGRLPITLLRKMVAQNIVARCRALLSLQPVKMADAEALDVRLSAKIHAILGMPFSPNSKILTLPVSLHGLGFPSIARINAGIAVDGLARDLNHHIAAYRSMARITLAEWTCSINNCVHPLDKRGLRRGFTHYYKKIPAAWITAHGVMSSLTEPLSLRMTDHHEILRGDVAISHAISLCNYNRPAAAGNADGNTLRTMRSKNIRVLADLGSWRTDQSGVLSFAVDWTIRRNGRWTGAQKTNWLKIVDALESMQVNWLFDGPDNLLVSREDRRQSAETNILQLVAVCALQPSRTVVSRQMWGTDGSMIPASATLCERRNVTAAATGPSTVVVRLEGRNLSILHGELMGHIVALVLRSDEGPSPILYSDHQNSVDLIHDIRTRACQDSRLRNMNGRSYYRWILGLTCDGPAKFIDRVPIAPTPTFFMDPFTFFTNADGWIESNTRTFIDFFMARDSASKLALGNRMRMLTWAHDSLPPPDYPYTRALSAHSAVIQLYARSGQLPTAETLELRSKLNSGMCRLGCSAIESMHHIFVDCIHFSQWRVDAVAELVAKTELKLTEAGISAADQQWFILAAKFMFSDEPAVWPLKMSQFYVGQLPRICDHLTITLLPNAVKRRRLMAHISADWHTSAIRLAGRIFGSIQRTMAARADLIRKLP
ncbi:hypothetical protein C8R46DRAFT_881750 [Mycena filopes]|nr:hypothetical protein C8R46DRAFT_881750 [Mycena filopes]